MKNENFETCKEIVNTLEAIASGNLYQCPECGELITDYEYNDDIDRFICGKCLCHCDAEPEPYTFYEYFADCLDITYYVGGDKEYRGVRVMVACGGPNIYIDTFKQIVELYWYNEYAKYEFFGDTADAIDAYFNDLYDC